MKPVAIVFAREVSAPVTSLVKKLEEATVKNSDAQMCAFVVFLSDDSGLEKKLKDLAEKEKLKNTALTIDQPSGPEDYKIAKEADVTVVLYVGKTAEVTHAFRKGELNDKAIATVLGDLPKITEKGKDKK